MDRLHHDRGLPNGGGNALDGVRTHVAEHILGHGPNPDGTGLCKYGADSARWETEVVAEPRKPLKYRIAIRANGEPALMPTSF